MSIQVAAMKKLTTSTMTSSLGRFGARNSSTSSIACKSRNGSRNGLRRIHHFQQQKQQKSSSSSSSSLLLKQREIKQQRYQSTYVPSLRGTTYSNSMKNYNSSYSSPSPPTLLMMMMKNNQYIHKTTGFSNSSSIRQIHFLPFLGMFGIKHLTSYTLYKACQSYGWNRVYRRLLEQNKLLNGHQSIEVQNQTKKVIKMAIQLPPQFVTNITLHYEQTIQPLLQQMIQQAERTATRHANPNSPGYFIISIIKTMIDSQRPVRIIKDMIQVSKQQQQRVK